MLTWAAALGAFAASSRGAAHAGDLKIELGGKIQSDLRLRLQGEQVGDFFNKAELPTGVERNQNLFSLKFKASYGAFSGVASADVYLNAVGATLKGFDDLSKYNAVQPFTFEPQSIYVEGKDLLLRGMDLRIGNQLVMWGVADQFNPTNNLNADDLRDPLLFGKQQPNFMVKLDYWLTKSFSMSGVLVPIFKPALLPAAASLGALDIQRMPFANDAFRHRIESEFGFASSKIVGYPTVIDTVTPVLPEPNLDNMQFAYRLAGTVGEQDIALSYYWGRTDFPQPFSNHTRQVDGARCDPDQPKRCIQGTLRTDSLLGYPRMHVWGLNVSGEVNPLQWLSETIHGIGYRIEAALVVPERATLRLTQDALPALLQRAGEYAYDRQPDAVEAVPFLKWTVGLDYTFGAHVYANAMWVHGLADEYGAGDFLHPGWTVRASGVGTVESGTPWHPGITGRGGLSGTELSSRCVVPKNGQHCAAEILAPKLGDYVVLGADLKFLNDAGLFRLFTIWSLSGVTLDEWSDTQNKRVSTHRSMFTPEGFSASVYPELDYNVGNGLELGTGALVLFGRKTTKFGDPAAGGSLFFVRGRVSF